MTPNDTHWALLYRAIVEDLGLSEKTFQLLYPFTSWTWPTSSVGYTSAPEHDFCATMPQWSATGAYFSSGARTDDAYGLFLGVLKAHTPNLELEREIARQQERTQRAKNAYDHTYRQAAAAYETATGGSNSPTFTAWLATDPGAPWARRLDDALADYDRELAQLEALLQQTELPGLKEAVAAYGDREYYLRYTDPGLAGFPPVPGYTVTQSPSEWVEAVESGDRTPGTIRFEIPAGAEAARSARRSPYASTWAGGSLPVPYPFFGSAEARPPALAEPPGPMEVTIELASWAPIGIEPLPWYRPAFVAARRNGPFLPGFSGDPQPGSVHLWQEGGAFSLRKTGLLVAYQPVFHLAGEPTVLEAVAESIRPSGELRIGPFVGDADGDVHLARGRGELVLASASRVPMIFGVTVEVLPGGPAPATR